ncbi:MAG: hypothetical protein HKP61_03030 [Dactylosporangium sp.]|nr:hypothetical protein [Dactylosporangium sp.]NNJ59929.1 hypothetical protein [Dactylosporangium sp.]
MTSVWTRFRSAVPLPHRAAAIVLIVAAVLVPASVALGYAHPTGPLFPPPHTLVGVEPLDEADPWLRVCEWDSEGQGLFDCYYGSEKIAGHSYAVVAPLSPGLPADTPADRLAVVYIDQYVGGWGSAVEEPVHRTLGGHPAVEIAETLDDGAISISTYVFVGQTVIYNSCKVYRGFWGESMRRECAGRLRTWSD